MKIEKVRIISFIPHDENEEKRIEAHQKQLDFFLSLGLLVDVVCILPSDNHIIKKEGVTHKIINEKTLPGSARNIHLREFYESDEDFTILADNDSFFRIDGKYAPSGIHILDALKNNDFEGVDLFVPVDGAMTPYSVLLEQSDAKDNFVFSRTNFFRGCVMFVRNIKKHYEKEIYFNSEFEVDGSVIPGEDTAFGFEFIENGLGAYRCDTLILKEYMRDASSWVRDLEQRKIRNEKMRSTLAEVFSIPLKTSGGLNYAAFLDRHRVKKRVTINVTGKTTTDLLDF